MPDEQVEHLELDAAVQLMRKHERVRTSSIFQMRSSILVCFPFRNRPSSLAVHDHLFPEEFRDHGADSGHFTLKGYVAAIAIQLERARIYQSR